MTWCWAGRWRGGFLGLIVGLGIAGTAAALDLVVDSTGNDGTGTLRDAIERINVSSDATNKITFAAGLAGETITLTGDLTPIFNNVVIDGDIDGDDRPVTISGGGAHRIFTVTNVGKTVDVTINDLALVDGYAEGGQGGTRAGGGLGAGAAVFVDVGSNATLVDVTFDGMAAVGGAGGADDATSGGGGGGMLADGGAGSGGGAGGGGGVSVDTDGNVIGVDGDPGTDLQGGKGGGPGGGPGGAADQDGEDGLPGGGGGGAGPGSADGGDGSDYAGGGGATGSGAGGAGGFAAGGGGSGAAADSTGGRSDFGGGYGATSGAGGGGSAFGGAVFVRAGGTLTISREFDTIGDGDLGDNTVTGGTGGTIGAAAGEDLYVMAGVDVEFAIADQGSGKNTLTVNGDIAGEGGIEKTGAGTLRLNGMNSYAGGTTVSGGTLVGDAGSIPGDVSVGSAGTLRFEQTGSGTYAGNLEGEGTVEKASGGTLTLRGDNSGLGGLFVVSGGTLVGSTETFPGEIQDDATLTFAQSADGSYAGDISGSGIVRKEGSGRLTLPGDYSYSGGTLVADGELELTGNLLDSNNDVSVQSGAWLTGGGSIAGSLTAQPGGTIAPGTSIGTLTVGSVTFEIGSIFEVELDPDTTACDLISANSGATVNGGSIDVILSGDPHLDPGGTKTYTVIDANSTNLGFFDSAGDLALFDIEQEWNGSNLELILSRSENGLVDYAATPNQLAVASVLEAAYSAGDPDLEEVFDAFAGLPPSALPDAFDAIGGEGHTAFTTAQIAHADAFVRTISSRMAVVSGRAIGSAGTADLVTDLRRAVEPLAPEDLLAYASLYAYSPLQAGGMQAAAAAPDVAMGPSESGRRFGLWLDGVGLLGGVSGNGNSADTDWLTGGVNLGFDVRLGRHVLLGLGGGYGRLDVDVDDRDFDGDANVFQGALYAAWVGERLYMSGLGRYAWADFETRRGIAFDGFDRTARADYDGHELGGYVEAGYVAFAPGGVQIEPIGAFHFLRLERDGFTESGVGALNLEVDDESWSSLVASAGLRIHKTFAFDEAGGLSMLPELRVRYGHEFGDVDRDLDAVLTGAGPDGAFSLTGASMARGGVLLGAGWTVLRGDDLGFFLQYDAHFNSDLLAHALLLGGVVRW